MIFSFGRFFALGRASECAAAAEGGSRAIGGLAQKTRTAGLGPSRALVPGFGIEPPRRFGLARYE
jgi:hypothetical protein